MPIMLLILVLCRTLKKAIEKPKKWDRIFVTIFLVLVVLSQGVSVVAAISDPLSGSALVTALGGCTALLLSGWRFMERRLKRTEVTYEFFIMLAARLPKSNGALHQ